MIEPEETTGGATSEVAVKTPVKKTSTPRKQSGKKAKKENDDEPTTPTALPKKKATPKAKKGAVEAGENGEVADATPTTETKPKSSSKKRGSKAAEGAEGAEETPTKKAKVDAKITNTTAKRAKAPANKFPESHADFNEQDKFLYDQRKAGKSFDEIAPLWTAITGTTPGKDVLRKRFAKLAAIGKDWEAGHVRPCVLFFSFLLSLTLPVQNVSLMIFQVQKMTVIKLAVEAELATAAKKAEAQKWTTISERMKTEGLDTYKPAAIMTKFDQLQKKGLVDAQGVYIGTDDVVADAGPATAVSGVTNGVANGIKAASEGPETLQVEEDANGEGEDMEED